MEAYYINFWSSLVILGLGLGFLLCSIPVHPIKGIGQTIIIVAANAGVVYLVILTEQNGKTVFEYIKLVLYGSSFAIDLFIAQDSHIDFHDPTLIGRKPLLAGFAIISALMGTAVMLYLVVSTILPTP
jgi:hypothetical protein